jgi:CheY-like chemotaxis protein
MCTLILKNIFNIEAETAMNGKIALEIVQSNISQYKNYYKKYEQNEIREEEPRHFDVIILDLNMPIMGGFEALKFMKDAY